MMRGYTGKPEPRIYFTKKEADAIGLGINKVIHDIKKYMADPTQNWTEDAKRIQLDILANATSAAAKLLKFTNVSSVVPKASEEDIKKFHKQ